MSYFEKKKVLLQILVTAVVNFSGILGNIFFTVNQNVPQENLCIVFVTIHTIFYPAAGTPCKHSNKREYTNLMVRGKKWNLFETSLSLVTVQHESHKDSSVRRGTFPLTGKSNVFLLLTLRSGAFTDITAKKIKKKMFVTSPQFEGNTTEDTFKKAPAD